MQNVNNGNGGIGMMNLFDGEPCAATVIVGDGPMYLYVGPRALDIGTRLLAGTLSAMEKAGVLGSASVTMHTYNLDGIGCEMMRGLGIAGAGDRSIIHIPAKECAEALEKSRPLLAEMEKQGQGFGMGSFNFRQSPGKA